MVYSPKMVSFDLWQTLIKSNPDYKLPRTLLIAQFFNYQGDLNWLYQNIITKVNKETDRLIDNDGIPRGLHHRLVEMYRLLYTCQTVPFNASDVSTFSSQLCGVMSKHPPLLIEDDVLETIKNLKQRGYKTAVISNSGLAESTHMKIALEVIGLNKLMDYILYSHEEGISKPNPAIFLKLSEISGVLPKNILHIGDNVKADYHGAINAGFEAVVLENEANKASCNDIPSIQSIRSLLTLLN